MSAKKAKPAAPPAAFSILKSAVLRGRWILGIVLFLAVLGVSWRLAWNRVRERVLSHADYQVNLQDIVVTPPPPWVPTDLTNQVIRDASLEGSLSILEEDLTKRVANAFSAHPWVAKVNRVRKQHPARLEVELTYRQPVAMVEVAGGVLPVDAMGTVLPGEDFLPKDAMQYPRIARIESLPAGLEAGIGWGDVHVTGAAQIAGLLGPRWQALKLYRVMAPVRGGVDRDVDGYTFELSTRSGTRIIWGRPPGNEPTGEAPALEKINLLERIAAECGSLDGPDAPPVIDLRTLTTPRTAVKPK